MPGCLESSRYNDGLFINDTLLFLLNHVPYHFCFGYQRSGASHQKRVFPDYYVYSWWSFSPLCNGASFRKINCQCLFHTVTLLYSSGLVWMERAQNKKINLFIYVRNRS